MYPLRALPPSTLDGLRPAPEPHASYDLDKRAVDVLLALFFSLLATPLILVAALAIVCESRRNPFFIQRRVGLLGSEFSMIKLRTMQPGAHRNIPLELNETDGPTFKAKEDPRITPVGRIIRKTSVDELPQLFNVLIGNMSLVGPRPALPREVAFYSASDAERLTVKPGITGISRRTSSYEGRSRAGSPRPTHPAAPPGLTPMEAGFPQAVGLCLTTGRSSSVGLRTRPTAVTPVA